MSIDTKGIQRVVWRIITYSGSCYGYGRKYPVVSGFLIFVFFLYICFPLVFYYLICSSPILVTFVSIRFYFKTKYPEFQRIRMPSIQRSYVDVNRSSMPSIRNLKSVRRNARMEVPEWDRKDFEEMSNFSPRSSLFSNNKNALDENSEFISSIEAGNDRGQSGRGPHGVGVGAQVEVESTEEKEEAYNGGKRAIEWTEDGQNNVMVLGTLESERNQRLESLMAKRRARKLFKMAVDQSLMKLDAILPTHLAPILTRVSNNPYDEILRMPGSAPSIMMAMENPFDLPYDPHEEKPDLMADSFQQEFMTANHKEFCRHESFCRGTLLTRDPNDAQLNHYYSSQRTLVEGPTESRFKLQSGNHNEATNSTEGKYELIRERSVDGIEVEGEKMGFPHGLEVKMETDLVNNNDSCYTSSSEDMESVEIGKDQMRKAFNLLVPPKGKTVNTAPYDFSPSPSPSERPRPDFNSFYSTPHCPASTCSIASDLQVEVSEVGSPPLTTDGDSVSYEGNVDRDINSDTEEVWGDSFNLSRGEANAQKLRELGDIIEEDSVQVDLSGLKRKFDDPNVLPSQEAKNSTQNMEPNSVQRRDNSIQNDVSGSNAMDINRRLLIEQISDNSFSSPRSVLPQNNLEDVQKPQENHKHQLAENSVDQLSSNSSLGTSEGSCNTTEKTTDYKSAADRMNKLALEDTQGKADSSIQSSEGEPKTLISSKDAKELSRTFNKSNTNFTEHLEGGSEKLSAHDTGIDPSPSESEEKNTKSDGPETMAVKEKEPSSSTKVVQEGNVVVNINNSVVNVMEQSKATGLASAQSVEETKHETERLAEAKANAGLPTSAGESNSLNNIKNGEEMQILTGHDGIIKAPQSKESKHKAIDHKAAMEAGKR